MGPKWQQDPALLIDDADISYFLGKNFFNSPDFGENQYSMYFQPIKCFSDFLDPNG